MIRNWPGVADTEASAAWYCTLLGCSSSIDASSSDRLRFDQLVDSDGSVLLCLLLRSSHVDHWGAEPGPLGKGVELYFVVDDFEDAWERAKGLDAR